MFVRTKKINITNICGDFTFLFNNIFESLDKNAKSLSETVIIFPSTQYIISFKIFLRSKNFCAILPKLYSIYTIINEYTEFTNRNYYDDNIVSTKIFTEFKGLFHNNISYANSILSNIREEDLTEDDKIILSNTQLKQYIQKYYRYTRPALIKDAISHITKNSVHTMYIVGFSYESNDEKIIINTVKNHTSDIISKNFFFFNLFEEQKLQLENIFNIETYITNKKSEDTSFFDIALDINKKPDNANNTNSINNFFQKNIFLYLIPLSYFEISKCITDIILQSYNCKKEQSIVLITSDDKLKMFLSKYLFDFGWSIGSDIYTSELNSSKFAIKILDCIIFGATYYTIGTILHDNYVKTEICNYNAFLNEKNIINKYLYSGHSFDYCISLLSDNKLKELFNDIKQLILPRKDIASTIKAYIIFIRKYLDYDNKTFIAINNLNNIRVSSSVLDIQEYKDILNFIFKTSKTKRKLVYKKIIRIYSPSKIRDIINVDNVVIASPESDFFDFTKTIDKKYNLYSMLNNNKKFHIFCNQNSRYSEFMLLALSYVEQQDFQYKYLHSYLEEYEHTIDDINKNKYNHILSANPTIEERPKKISCSALKVLIQDPYQFYLDYILKLDREEYKEYFSINKKLIGTVIHNILELVGKNTVNSINKNIYDDTADNIIRSCIYRAISDKKEWFIYIYKKAKDIVNEVFKILPFQSSSILETTCLSEILGISVHAKLDRVDINTDGHIFIYDYKTGAIPQISDTLSGYEPQLLLQALLYCRNFNIDFQNIKELSYVKINFEYVSVEIKNVLSNKVDIIEVLSTFEKNIEEVIDFYLLSQNELKVDLRYI